MAEYIEREALLLSIRDDPEINGKNFAMVKRHIEEASAADVVEVVRCKDCKRCFQHITKRHKQLMWLCMRHDLDLCVRPDDYCSYGERKETE